MKLICVTNRKLCAADFLQRIEAIAAAGVDAILLREKDLPEASYRSLALHCQSICQNYHTPLILNTFAAVAAELHLPVQLSMALQSQLPDDLRSKLPAVGASVHSLEEAVSATQHGADWLIAGHIFPTACKADLPPRGVQFLQEICENVSIPVYAIGGITAERQQIVQRAGAAGCCVMSELMQCHDPKETIYKWKC